MEVQPFAATNDSKPGLELEINLNSLTLQKAHWQWMLGQWA